MTVSRNAFDVIIQWDSGGTAATPFTLYSDAPYSLSAVQANQKEPFLKTFGSLLRCNGGILIIGQKRYRIQVQQQEQQYPGKRQLEEMVDDRIAAKLRVQRAKRPTRTLSYISKSTALDNTTILRRVWFHQSFFFDLIRLPHGFHTEAFKTPGPLETSDEKKVHHPRFIKELEKLVESFTTATKENKSDTVLRQRVLWSKSGHWLKMDDRTTGVEPDFCFQEIVSPSHLVTPRSDAVVLPHSKYSVTVALEQKKKISHSDQVEAIDYGERLIIIQDRSDS